MYTELASITFGRHPTQENKEYEKHITAHIKKLEHNITNIVTVSREEFKYTVTIGSDSRTFRVNAHTPPPLLRSSEGARIAIQNAEPVAKLSASHMQARLNFHNRRNYL